MPRVKRGSNRRERREKLLGLAKGFFLNKSKLYRAAKEAVDIDDKESWDMADALIAAASGRG